jgi:hypothetical protein
MNVGTGTPSNTSSGASGKPTNNPYVINELTRQRDIAGIATLEKSNPGQAQQLKTAAESINQAYYSKNNIKGMNPEL